MKTPMGLPDDIADDLERTCVLHERVSADYGKCVEFNRLMADLLARLEDGGYDRLADRVMTILLDCNPKEGCSCEKSSRVGEMMKKLGASTGRR